MFVPLAVIFLQPALIQGPTSLTLTRGCELPERATRYWSVEDTVLDAKAPDTNSGGALFLEAGPGKPLLIRFGDLNRAIGPGKRVLKAAIKLATGGGGIPLLESASRILAPWGEGPVLVIAPYLKAPSQNAPDPTANWSATWKNRHTGAFSVPWQVAGAKGPSDAEPIPGAKLFAAGAGFVTIEGLADAVQFQLDHPLQNCGFKFEFEGTTEFYSSQSVTDRPQLILELGTAPEKHGADLSIVCISQSPAFERYAPSKMVNAEQDGATVGLPNPPPNASSPHWPSDGDLLTYTATIKNVGDAPASPFTVRWSISERPGSATEIGKTLAPGESTTVTTTAAYKSVSSDHRCRPIQLSIEQKTPDACPANDALEIQESALSFAVVAPESFAAKFKSSTETAGARCFEDWIQAQVRFLNDVAFPQSRFSFARNGILERVRIQNIQIVPDAQFAGAANAAEQDLSFDGALLFDSGTSAEMGDADRGLLLKIGAQLGLIQEFGSFSGPGAAAGAPLPLDEFPGLMGFGDTRNESLATTLAELPYGPFNDPMFSVAMEHSDLFSATDAAALNAWLGKRRGISGGWMYHIPAIVFVTAKDFLGTPIANAELTFYAFVNGKAQTSAPAFTVKTNAMGSAFLPKRQTGAGEEMATVSGETLKPNAFGRLDPAGRNGAFVVKAAVGGISEWTYLKAWHVLDTVSRNPIGPTIMTLRFNISDQPVDAEIELAKGKIVTDSAKSLPAQLAPLLDGDVHTSAQLPTAADAWIEVDLGRDRSISEIDLLGDAGFWKSFTISGYSTGQTSDEAELLCQELDWPFSWMSRGVANSEEPKVKSVAYRIRTRRVRFLRIVNRSNVSSAALAEIQARPPQ